jgi:hypothetical protein
MLRRLRNWWAKKSIDAINLRISELVAELTEASMRLEKAQREEESTRC